MRSIPYLIYLLLAAMHIVIVKDATAIYGVTISLPSLMLLLVALYKEETTALWFGFAVGIVTAVPTPELIGWYALAMSTLSVAAFQVRQRLNLDSIWSRLLYLLGGLVTAKALILMIQGTDNVLSVVLTGLLPSALYTSAAAVLFFLFKDRLLTFEKLKSIF